MTLQQTELLCTIGAGMHPFTGVVGRRRGVIVRNLERLFQRGWLKHRGRSARYLLTRRARLMIGIGR